MRVLLTKEEKRRHILEYQRNYNKINREKRAEQGRRYRERMMEKDPDWRYNHAKRILSWAKNNRKFLINLLGNKCVRCGFNDVRALQIDHINGGGYKELKEKFVGAQTMYNYYKNHPEEANEKLQILCANCNWIKRSESKNETGGKKRVKK